MTNQYNVIAIRKMIIDSFKLDELEMLCYDHFRGHDISGTDCLEGETLPRQAHALVSRAEREGWLDELVSALRKERAHRFSSFEKAICSQTGRAYHTTDTNFAGEVDSGKLLSRNPSSPRPTSYPYRIQVGQALVALAELAKESRVRDAVVAFHTDFVAASEQIRTVGIYKQLHDLFQRLEDLYAIADGEQRRMKTDETAWEGVLLHEPDIRGVIGDLLDVATNGDHVIREVMWVQRLARAREELRAAIESFDTQNLEQALGLIGRVLDREPSRLNACLVEAAGTLRLSDLARAMATVRHNLIQTGFDIESVSPFADTVGLLVELEGNLTTLVNEHNRWQEIDDELRRVEATLAYDLADLELSWPDVKTMVQSLCGNNPADWVVSLNRDGTQLEQALGTVARERAKIFFLRYRSQASRRLHHVDTDLLAFCQDLQKIGDSLNLLMRMMQ